MKAAASIRQVKSAAAGRIIPRLTDTHLPNEGNMLQEIDGGRDDRPYRDRAELFAVRDGKVFGSLYPHGGFGVYGGGVDPGEDPATAAAREFREESGYDVGNVRELPFDPHVVEWTPPYAGPKQVERAKHFRGTRTRYFVGDLGEAIPDAVVDELGRRDPGLYDFDSAAVLADRPEAIVDGPAAVAANKIRARILAHLRDAAQTAKAAALLPSVQLQPHQQRIADEAAAGAVRKLLVHGLGSGKGLSSIAAMEQDDDPYVAVVPAALRPNYRKELAKFTDRDMLPTVLSYNALAAGQAPNTSKLVLDEVQRLRNPDSAQTKAVLDAAGKAKSLIMLSGTPVVNRPGDLAVPLQLLTGKKMTPDEFEARYVEHKPVYSSFLHRLLGTSSGTEPVIRRRKELEALLRGHVDYYMPEKPVVPVDYEDHEIEMSVPQVQLYRAMLDKLPWHIRRQLNQSVDPAPEDMTRLMAFMTGPRQVGLSTLPFRRDKDPLKAFEQSPKLQTALAKLKEHLTDDRKKALVFANFIDAGLTPYSAALTREGIPHGVFHGGLSDADRQRLVDDYNEGRIRAALIGPSGTEGLSFKGTQLVQLLDPHWQQTRPRQAVGRGLRFDSHEGLPDELKRVRVQRFISKLPGGLARRLARLTGGQDPEIDRYLQATAERKDKENALMLGLLKDVGTPKAAADALPALLAAKRESDRRNYPAKHEALVRLLRSSPQDFEIDSAVDGTVGLTHSPTGFRIHMPAVKLPTAFLTRGRHEDDRTA